MKEQQKEDKYYIPELSEFHTEFEYEVLIPHTGEWSKEVFFLNDSHIGLVKYVNIQNEDTLYKIRVKYLDKQDIESLGWEFESEYVAYYKHKLYVREFWGPPESRTEHKERYKLFFRKGEITISNDQSYDDYESFFQGTIKNKSELKVLMKQLGIDGK